jgi:hypothetical protein
MTTLKDRAIMIKYCEALGREGVAQEIIKICGKVVLEGNYKNALVDCGRLHALSLGCAFDVYWQEKKYIGFNDQVSIAEQYLEVNTTKR